MLNLISQLLCSQSCCINMSLLKLLQTLLKINSVNIICYSKMNLTLNLAFFSTLYYFQSSLVRACVCAYLHSWGWSMCVVGDLPVSDSNAECVTLFDSLFMPRAFDLSVNSFPCFYLFVVFHSWLLPALDICMQSTHHVLVWVTVCVSATTPLLLLLITSI